MKSFKKHISILAGLALAGFLQAEAQESVQTPWVITGGAFANGNIHSASFEHVVPSAERGGTFTNGFGIGASMYAGVEYIPLKNTLFGIPYRITGRLSLSLLSAPLTTDYYFGNVISGSSSIEGNTRQTVDATIGLLALEPGILFAPFENTPLSFLLGAQLGMPLMASYTQKEEWTNVAPAGSELQTNYGSSGDLPDKSPLYAAFSFGAQYEAVKFGNFVILPEVQFNYALTNFTSSLEWKANSVRGGIAVRYNLVKTIPPPFVEPPPAEPKTLKLSAEVFKEGTPVAPGSVITVTVPVNAYVTQYALAPIAFFEKNSSRIALPRNEQGFKTATQEEAQAAIANSLKNYLRLNPQANVTIVGSASADEEHTIARQRAEGVAQFLKAQGIAGERISTNQEISKDNLRYEELREEQRYVRFAFSNNQTVVLDTVMVLGNRPFEASSAPKPLMVEFTARPNFIAEAAPYQLRGIVTGDGVIKNLAEMPETFSIPVAYTDAALKPVSVNYTITDAEGKTISSALSFSVKPIQEIRKVENEVLRTGDTFQEYVLGYFRFDESRLYATNSDAIAKAQAAFKNGKKIQIIAMTDNLGTPEYNAQLARQRAQAARELFGKNAEVEVVYPADPVFSNATPQGRVLNRSVMLRIME
ncbi:MAG TPA: OmpA family protein [Patescibacteria group bacterium]|nr:OmpA family protein [Patescibacteria group bacterium]